MKRVLRNAGGETVDEIVVTDCTVHIEQMDSNSYWIGITDAEGNSIAVNLTAGGPSLSSVEAKEAAANTAWARFMGGAVYIPSPVLTCTVEADGPGWKWDEDREHKES